MLKGKYVSDKVRGYYDQWPIFQPIVQVSLGIDRDLSGDPHSLSLPFPNPVAIAGQERTHMTFRHYGYDPTMAPPGKSVVTVMFISNHAYWKNLSGDAERYEAEKKDIAIKVIDRLEARFPGIRDQIEVVDVATPLTYERYTGNWQGSMEGWLITSESMQLMMSDKGMDKTVPGLDRFYMVGQWVEPGGGLPPAATSGRNAIRAICEQDGIEFSASLP
jgi:phytoene dehydrogenase-like protein